MRIYRLLSEGGVRYIGKTSNTLAKRLQEHLREARSKKRNHRLCWLRSLDVPPTIELIREVAGDGGAEEIYEIALARAYGCRLVNGTDGGEGSLNPSEETRKKKSDAMRKWKRSPEWCANIAAALRGKPSPLRGRPFTPEHKENISLAKRGRGQSAEHIKNRAATRIGTKQSPEWLEKRFSPEARANMSAAQLRRFARNRGEL